MSSDRHAVYRAALRCSIWQFSYQAVQAAVETSSSGTKQAKTNTPVVQLSSCTGGHTDF